MTLFVLENIETVLMNQSGFAVVKNGREYGFSFIESIALLLSITSVRLKNTN